MWFCVLTPPCTEAPTFFQNWHMGGSTAQNDAMYYIYIYTCIWWGYIYIYRIYMIYICIYIYVCIYIYIVTSIYVNYIYIHTVYNFCSVLSGVAALSWDSRFRSGISDGNFSPDPDQSPLLVVKSSRACCCNCCGTVRMLLQFGSFWMTSRAASRSTSFLLHWISVCGSTGHRNVNSSPNMER